MQRSAPAPEHHQLVAAAENKKCVACVMYNYVPYLIKIFKQRGKRIGSAQYCLMYQYRMNLPQLSDDEKFTSSEMNVMKVLNPGRGLTLMHVAAFYDSLECLVYLHKTCEMDLNCQSDKAFVPLQFACAGGAVECADYLLAHGADPNEVPDMDGMSPLFLAVLSGNAKLVTLLFDSGAKFTDEMRVSSKNPLEQALKRKNIDIVEIMLSRGVSMKAVSANGRLSPLMYAIAIGLSEAVEPLLNRGVDPNYKNDQNSCALFLAFRENMPDVVQMLVDKGANVRFKSCGGYNAVHAACQAGSLELVKKAVDLGALPMEKDDRGRLPTFATLMISKDHKDKMIPILEYLIDELHLDINAKDDNDVTLLGEVLSEKKRMTPQLAQFLLSRGANVQEVTPNGKTIWELAMDVCEPAVKNVFVAYRSKNIR